MDILKLYRSHAYIIYSNYNRVLYDSNNCILIKQTIFKISYNNYYLIIKVYIFV